MCRTAAIPDDKQCTGGIIIVGENLSNRRKSCPSVMANPTWTAPHDVTQYLLCFRTTNVITLTTVSFYCAEGIVLGCAVQ